MTNTPIREQARRGDAKALVGRLREYATALGISIGPHVETDLDEAAATIESLQREAEAMAEALGPFASYAIKDGFGLDNHGQAEADDQGVGWVYLTLGDFRRAASALATYRKDRPDGE